MNIERADAPATVKVVRGEQEIAFVATNRAMAWRAQTVMSKEPGTVSWIEEFGAEADQARRNAGPFSGVGNYVFRGR